LLRTHPFVFESPVDIEIRLPDICTSTGEAEGLEAHRFERDVARENHQVSPRDFFAILLLDRPQQPASAVEVYVVGPTIERGKTLLASASTSATVTNTVCACTVPRHANEQRTVMAEVCRQPVLRIRHE